MLITPEYLQSGDLILITPTARKITSEELKPALDWIESNGWRWELAPGLESVDHQFAGDDAQRTKMMQWCFDHPEAKAIWCARGGYGTARMVDQLNWEHFLSRPKWLNGYSDVTALHCEIHNRGIKSIHCTMPISVSTNTPEALQSLADTLRGKHAVLSAEANALSHNGLAKGELIGGNLSVLYSILNSPSQVDLEGKILFLEDLDEYLYHIDRMMLNLTRNGWWDKVAGLVVGGMTDMNDNAVPFGQSAEEIVSRHLAPYNIPVGFGLPFGHIDDNRAVVCGCEAQFEVTDAGSVLRMS